MKLILILLYAVIIHMSKDSIALARVIILKLCFIMFDESTSFFDISMQAQIINLLRHLQQRYHFLSVYKP